MRRLLTAVFLLPTLFGFSEAQADDVTMTVKPVLCVTDNRNPTCEMAFLVIWESSTSGYYCLYNDFGDAAVRCWNEDREGRVTDERTVDASFSYWMTGNDGEARVAQVNVEVLRMGSNDRRRNRRTRHVWDIN